MAAIIENIEDKQQVGVFGYLPRFCCRLQLRTKEAYDNIFAKFNKIVGFQYLRAMYLNDVKSELANHFDRHQSLELGNIGYTPFSYIMKDN